MKKLFLSLALLVSFSLSADVKMTLFTENETFESILKLPAFDKELGDIIPFPVELMSIAGQDGEEIRSFIILVEQNETEATICLQSFHRLPKSDEVEISEPIAGILPLGQLVNLGDDKGELSLMIMLENIS